MKKIWLLVTAVLSFSLLLAVLVLQRVTPTAATTATINSFLPSPGSLQLSFCPRDNCEKILTDFLDAANSTIHCALFEIDLESVKKVLLEKSTAIEVKVVTDNDYLSQFNHSFVRADKWGLMHNKFCVIDGKTVSTGSMNPTENDAHKNNNNLMLISSSLVAQNYGEEFQELWNGQFKGGEEIRNPQILVGTVPLKIYFCPEDHCADQVKEELRRAKHSIQFMTFSFTHEGIANVLLLQHLEGIPIQGIMEARQISEYSKFPVLQYQLGAENVIKDSNPRNLHHKVFIIDGETVITGSFNPTEGGNERNDENLLIIKDKEIAGKFGEEWEKLYGGHSNP
ncbi:MAG: phospholipase D-like domain-containing protein [Nanoarchaeota archaeon]